MRRLLAALVTALTVAALVASCGSGGGSPPAGPSGTRAAVTSPPRSSAAASVTGSAHGASPPAAAAATPSAARPCGTAATPPPRWAHVVWVWMENRTYSAVLSGAPYVRGLAARCGLATDYHGVTHPSLPNYLASVAGTTGGVTSDCGPASCPQSARTIFQQLRGSGREWRAYDESMPANCSRSATDRYAPKHNPAVYYPAMRADCERWDVPLVPALPDALRTGALPAFAFVTPDICHDMHDCSTTTGDRWLATWMPRILDSPAYRAGRTAVVLTWDEGEGGDNRIVTVVVSPSTRPGTKAGERFDHYSLLRTTEEMLGLPLLGRAASAATMRAAFRL